MIEYPNTWKPETVEKMREMFAQARARGLWFYHSSLTVGTVWMSPSGLEKAQRSGQFLWGPPNWRLRPPGERLAEYDNQITKLMQERKEFEKQMAEEEKLRRLATHGDQPMH